MRKCRYIILLAFVGIGCTAKSERVVVTAVDGPGTRNASNRDEGARNAGGQALDAALALNDQPGMEADVNVRDHLNDSTPGGVNRLLPGIDNALRDERTTPLSEPDPAVARGAPSANRSSDDSPGTGLVRDADEADGPTPIAGNPSGLVASEPQEPVNTATIPKELDPGEVVTRTLAHDETELGKLDRADNDARSESVGVDNRRKLLAQLLDEDPRIRLAALTGLAEFEKTEKVIAAITARLGDEDKSVATSARGALRVIGSSAVGSLVNAVQHGEPRVQIGAIRTLTRFDAESAAAALNPLVEALTNGNDETRAAAATALGHIDYDASEVVPPLVKSLSDENKLVQQSAARALGSIGPSAQAAIGPLRRIQGTGDYWVKLTARDAVRSIAPGPRKQPGEIAAR